MLVFPHQKKFVEDKALKRQLGGLRDTEKQQKY